MMQRFGVLGLRGTKDVLIVPQLPHSCSYRQMLSLPFFTGQSSPHHLILNSFRIPLVLRFVFSPTSNHAPAIMHLLDTFLTKQLTSKKTAAMVEQ